MNKTFFTKNEHIVAKETSFQDFFFARLDEFMTLADNGEIVLAWLETCDNGDGTFFPVIGRQYLSDKISQLEVVKVLKEILLEYKTKEEVEKYITTHQIIVYHGNKKNGKYGKVFFCVRPEMANFITGLNK